MSIGKGSFRGVSFVTTEHQTHAGRRAPTYAIPFVDDAISVDVGRSIRKYSITCFVSGDDYRAKANALLEALEAPDAGTLVHPVYGRKWVTIGDDVSVKESTTRLRVVDFSFTATVVLESERTLDVVGPSEIAAVQNAAKKVKSEAVAVLSDPKRGGLPTQAIADWVRQAHIDQLQDALGEIRKVNGLVAAVTAIPSGFGADITALSQELTSVIQIPGRLASSLLGLLESIASAVNLIRDVDPIAQVRGNALPSFNRTSGTSGSITDVTARFANLADSQLVAGETAARREQRSGQVAITTTLRAMALASLAEAALSARYDSSNDARAVRDALSTALRALALGEPEPDNRLADLLRDLAAKVTAYLTRVAGTVAEIGTYETPTIMAAEVIAYRIYGDSELADQLVLMNRGVVQNPGAIPAFTKLEVWL